MKTAVIYARYSCDQQTEQSIDGQLRVCEEFAQRNNILILNTYIDRAMTGTNDNRPDFQRMIKDSAIKEWNYVIVYKLDRFSRNKYESTIHKRTLKNNGISVLSAMENIPDTPEGIILESLLEGMNQYYSAELAQKVKRGMKETRIKGYFQGGTLLYGYKLEGRKIVPDEFQAEVVRYIYDQFAKGVYVKNIMQVLNEKGVTHKGKPLPRNTVYNILKNDKYLGVYKHDDETVDNMYPQIVDYDTFEKVRAIVNANKHGKRSIDVVYLLRNKLKCGYCGQSIIAESGTSKTGAKMYYYKCRGRKARINDCTKQPIRKNVLENLVLDNIYNALKTPSNMEFIIKVLMKMQNNAEKENSALSILLKQQKQVENALNNLVTAIENGITSNTTNKRLHDLEKQQEQLERQILIERSKCAVKVPESEMREFYEQALRAEPQMLINVLIKEIIVFDDKIEIYYNTPLYTNPDDESRRGFSFYTNFVQMVTNEILLEMYI